MTPELIAAAKQGDEAAVSALLACGADANAVDHGGETALMHAAHHGHTGCISSLVAGGAVVDQANGAQANGDPWPTALMVGAVQGHIEACRQLLELGADVKLKAKSGGLKGMPAWKLAHKMGKPGVVALLKAWASGTRDAAELDRIVAVALASAPAPAPAPVPAPAPAETKYTPATPSTPPVVQEPEPEPELALFHPPAPALAGPKYTLSELQAGCPAGVSGANKEDALNDAEFKDHIKMSRDAFRALPGWKREKTKKALKIF